MSRKLNAKDSKGMKKISSWFKPVSSPVVKSDAMSERNSQIIQDSSKNIVISPIRHPIVSSQVVDIRTPTPLNVTIDLVSSPVKSCVETSSVMPDSISSTVKVIPSNFLSDPILTPSKQHEAPSKVVSDIQSSPSKSAEILSTETPSKLVSDIVSSPLKLTPKKVEPVFMSLTGKSGDTPSNLVSDLISSSAKTPIKANTPLPSKTPIKADTTLNMQSESSSSKRSNVVIRIKNSPLKDQTDGTTSRDSITIKQLKKPKIEIPADSSDEEILKTIFTKRTRQSDESDTAKTGRGSKRGKIVNYAPDTAPQYAPAPPAINKTLQGIKNMNDLLKATALAQKKRIKANENVVEYESGDEVDEMNRDLIFTPQVNIRPRLNLEIVAPQKTSDVVYQHEWKKGSLDELSESIVETCSSILI